MPTRLRRLHIPALKVNQWIDIWDGYEFSRSLHRQKPLDHFYVLSMRASQLKALSGVNRRLRTLPGLDLGIQRRHEERRSEEIARYIKYGFPYSGMSESRRRQPGAAKLRQPGWLPTAIVVNIVRTGQLRRGSSVHEKDLVDVRNDSRGSSIILPAGFQAAKWQPKSVYPIEVIDGQHRLFAFDETNLEDFEIPVVAFFGLDIGWQAYLFWTINIKPKKINASLAFDLYPLLRTQDWLEEGEDYSIYRETRAQELTENLWSYPKSAWFQRINMTGDSGRQYVSQSAWVRSFMASIIKRWDGRGVSIGGLFGSKMNNEEDPLPWSRIQQSAFMISFWNSLHEAVIDSASEWARALRTAKDTSSSRFKQVSPKDDPAFYGPHTLVNQDQGVRALIHILNDLFFTCADELDLSNWSYEPDDDLQDEAAITSTVSSFRRTRAYKFMKELTASLATFDWRSANAPGLSDSEQQFRKLYRGSGGYAELRRQCVEHLGKARGKTLRVAAQNVARRMRSAR